MLKRLGAQVVLTEPQPLKTLTQVFFLLFPSFSFFLPFFLNLKRVLTEPPLKS
jgi:hypothetical protein